MMRRTRASKFRGVYKAGDKWKAQIQIDGVQHYLGVFESEEDAARKYSEFAISHGHQLPMTASSSINFHSSNVVEMGHTADIPGFNNNDDINIDHNLNNDEQSIINSWQLPGDYRDPMDLSTTIRLMARLGRISELLHNEYIQLQQLVQHPAANIPSRLKQIAALHQSMSQYMIEKALLGDLFLRTIDEHTLQFLSRLGDDDEPTIVTNVI